VTPAELAGRIQARYPDVVVSRDEVIVVVDPEGLLEALAFLREDPDLGLDFLSSIAVVDRPGRDRRFWLSYELYSGAHRHRVRVKIGVAEANPHAPSVTAGYPTADWHEREAFDLFGIVFDGHPNLRRILLPDGWDGHPLRKTEELGGVNTRFKGAFIPPVDRRTS
jgi:NADH-quinone oxidoreductase subunit C